MKKLFLIALLLSMKTAVAATITDQPVNFGRVAYTSSSGSATVPVTVTFNCTNGAAYTLRPNASSSGNITLTLYREGISNGSAYMYFLNPGGTLMRSGIPSSLVTGTCTGTDQTVNLTAVISGSTTVGSVVAFNKTGVFSQSTQMLQLVSGGTTLPPAQQISGEIAGQCDVTAGPMSFGTIPSTSSARTLTAGTSVSVRCDNTLTHIIYPHDNAADFNLDSGMAVDVASPPRPTDPAKLKVFIRPTSTTNWNQWNMSNYSKTAVGNGNYQIYDVQGQLSLSAYWHGTINFPLNIKVVF